MPRTKISKNASKRNRENANDDKINTVLKEMDSKMENHLVEMNDKLVSDLDQISHWIKLQIGAILPEHSDLTLEEIENKSKVLSADSDVVSISSSGQVNSTFMSARKESHTGDEGYLTEGSASSSAVNVFENTTQRLAMGTSQKPTSRRSKSAQPVSHTPLKQNTVHSLLTNKKNRMTPMSSNHMSRSKYRTPMTNRLKASSADRMITPKIHESEPTVMLRYANVGETVVSLTGSPVVVPGQSLGNRPNINIPMRDGMLMLQPTETRSFNTDFIDRIDLHTLNHLKMLQKNLSAITKMVDERK